MTTASAEPTTSGEPAVAVPLEAPAGERRSLLGEAWRELRAVARFRPLVRYLVSSTLRTEHANTVFGFVWWVLDPLLLMAVYVLFIDVILRRGGKDFAVFVLTAIISWTFFQKSVQGAIANTITRERAMRQVAFPRTVIPLSVVLGESVHFLFGLVVLVVVAIPFGIYPTALVPLALPIALVQAVFTLGVAYFLSAINVFFRDTANLTIYALRIWFYLSPALYTLTLVPERFRHLYNLNPFATFLTEYRAVIMYHKVPNFTALGFVAAGSVAVLIVGYLLFVRLSPSFTKLV